MTTDKRFQLILSNYLSCILIFVLLFSPKGLAQAQEKTGADLVPIISLLLSNKKVAADKGTTGSPVLVGATSANATDLTLEWIPSTDDETAADKMQYEVHLSTTEGFEPTVNTKKLTVTGLSYTTATGLTAQTKYYAMIVAVDEDGNSSWSNQLSATTAATASVRTSDVVHTQSADHAPLVTPTTITYTPQDGTLPQTGEFISSVEGDGYLRRVTSVSQDGDQVVVTTEPASLAEIYQDLEFSTLIRMSDPQPTVAPVSQTKTLSATGTVVQTDDKIRTWPTGLTLTRKGDSSTQLLMSAPSAKSTSTATATSSQAVVDAGKYMDLSVPENSAARPDQWLEIPITYEKTGQKIKVCQEQSWWLKCDSYIMAEPKVCGADITDIDHPDSEKENLAPLPTENVSGIIWKPTKEQVDEKLRPYELELTAWIGPDIDGGCDNYKSNYSEKLQVNGINVYLENGEFAFDTERKVETFSETNFSLSNDVTLDFEPELDIQANIKTGMLKDASIIARGTLTLDQVLHALASASAGVSGEATVFEGSFIKVIPTTIPILVRGELELRLKATATAAAELDLDQEFINTFEVAFGTEYHQSSGWTAVKDMKNNYTLKIGGEATGGLYAQFDLIPDVKLHFYEAVSGHMILDPYLYADTAMEGHFQYLNEDGSQKTDLDYSFTKLEAGAGINLDLFAGLHVFDKTVVGYPSDGVVGSPETYAHFTPVDKTRFLGIPDIDAQVGTEVVNDLDSRAVLIRGSFEEVTNPLYPLWGFGKEHFIEFDQWTDGKLVATSSTCDAEVFPADTPGDYWLVPLTPGNCTVRLGAHSTLGWFVRQTVETSFDAGDSDNDGLPDYWEQRFGITDPNGDDDYDGNSNLAEFQNGTIPTFYDNINDTDFDGMPDWWEALYDLDPLSAADATLDDDSDGYTNLQEFLNGTDPWISDISPQGTVISAGRVWMDRNLGASRIATSSGDEEAYGDLYQWGRGTDGHEKRTSPTTTLSSTTNIPGHSSFIVTSSYPTDWRTPQNDDLWQGVLGANNPCPEGFRLPTLTEFDVEKASWSAQNTVGAFNSPLKLVPAGTRSYADGSINDVGSKGIYWSSTIHGVESSYLGFADGAAVTYMDPRALGFSVRCIQDEEPEEVTTVTSAGQVWMDRNLGAARVATSSTDEEAYGDLYQWGRGTDGHEKRDSGTTSTLSTSDTPGHGNFIIIPTSSYDWRSPQNDNLWQSVSGTNNPCPAGFRLPTATEWATERASWNSNDYADAYNSPLKLVPANIRFYYNGSLTGAGGDGAYWSSTVNNALSRWLIFMGGSFYEGSGGRAHGASVRCIQDYEPEEVSTVTSSTGQVWMDRNLGASRVATSSADEDAYGDLYQWGRGADGHEKRESATTSTLSTSDTPGHDDFILPSYDPYDWRTPQNDNLWQGSSGINNPCPAGFRLPTETEFETERLSWSSNFPQGAFESPLKLVVGGGRNTTHGGVFYGGINGYYWTSTVIGTYSRHLYFGMGYGTMDSFGRGYGLSVRCLKD